LEDGKPISPAAALVIAKQSGAMERTPTGLTGFDYILGGGYMRAKAVSFCGPEGAGKTSFLARLAISLEQRGIRFLLQSSEQSPEDLVTQFQRYGRVPRKFVSLVHETDMDRTIRLLERERPDVYALDSIHDIDGVNAEDGALLASGGNRAVHTIAKEIRKLSRALGTFSLLVCHMNNDGTMKGGTSLRHEVDGTLMVERPSNESDATRILRFRKYRFAPPSRRARFLMLDHDFKDCGPVREPDSKRSASQSRLVHMKPALHLAPRMDVDDE
jgi:DNA repair protein RadA/Sms